MRKSIGWRFLAVSALTLAIGACQFVPVVNGPKGPNLSPRSRWVSQEALDFITGGGWYSIQLAFGTQSGNQASFGWHGGVKNGQWWGNGNYIDHGTGLHVTVTSVTGYERLGTDGTDANGHPTGTREICGWADTDLYGTVRFVVQMTDNGEPGRSDSFAIALADPSSGHYVYESQGSLGDPTPGGGNIQLHMGNASNTLPSTEPDCITNPFSS
jgi:hypothetical protein